MDEIEKYDGSLYSYTAGCLCGVLITEKVMRKLAKAQVKHLEEVKRILHDNKDTDVFPSMWTLHYPEGKQTTVNFIDTSENVEQRIKNATMASTPRHLKLVFKANSMKEAEKMADTYYEKTGRTSRE